MIILLDYLRKNKINPMTTLNPLVKYPLLLLAFLSITVHSITFTTSPLNDSSASNYIEFSGVSKEFSNSFEKIVADFNGDGFDDILSLGGNIEGCRYSKCTPPPPPIPFAMEMMLYQGGEFINHPIDISNFSLFVNIIDIDADNDLDIVMANGEIAINDGHANFTTMVFSENQLSNQEFYTFDWDQDGDLDIVSSDTIFIHDGQLNFQTQNNSIVGNNKFIVTDLNADNIPDILLNSKSELQSWINNGQGQVDLLSSLTIENLENIGFDILMQPLDVNFDNAQDLMLTYDINGIVQIKLIINDGLGNLAISDFEFPETEDVEYNTLFVNKIITQDADNDGDEDLWLNITFTSADCSSKQNLILIYENTNDGHLLYKRSLHSIGHSYSYFSGVSATSIFPTLIDLNQDERMDVIMTGEQSAVWLSRDDYYFHLSSATSSQYNQHIDTVDFNGDGHADILSSGMYNNNCSVLPYSSNIHSTTYNPGGKLWLGDGNGDFSPYGTVIAGLTNFTYESEYSKFIDIYQNGQLFLISTLPAQGDIPRGTVLEDPLQADPPLGTGLPEPTKLVKAADLTNNGKLEIVMLADTEDAPIYVLEIPSNVMFTSQIIAELEFGYRDAEIKLVDIDNDGNIDIITNSKQETGSIKIWFNNGNGTFTPHGAFANGVKSIVISDFDGDGKPDILSSNEAHDIWINLGNRGFNKLDYDKSFWYTSDPTQPQELELVFNQIPDKIETKDLNSDGLIDLLAYSDNKVYVYMNSSSNGNVSFYRNYSSIVSDNYVTDLDKSNIAFADFNNDGKMDFASGGDGFIKINSQKEEQLSTGLFFNRSRSGHGFSIDNIGRDNLYYSVFYTYDNEGKPQWFSMLNRYQASETKSYSELTNINGNDILRYIYDYNTQSTTFDDSPEYLGRLVFLSDQIGSNLTQASYQIGYNYVHWPLEQLIADSSKPDVDLSGIWWAGSNDSGWGISLSFVQRENNQEVVAILYYYDDQGQPSWLIGQQEGFELNQETTINMQYIKGYGHSDNYVELSRLDAGSITLNLNQASNNLDDAGTLSMDLFYPNDPFVINNWIRDDIPIALFSKPRY